MSRSQLNKVQTDGAKSLSSDRLAEPDEKAVLVKYTGWGALPGAFEPQTSREWKGIADGSSHSRGVRIGTRLQAECPLHFSRSHSNDLEGDGAIWIPAGKLVAEEGVEPSRRVNYARF